MTSTPPSSPRVPVAPGAPSRPRTRGIIRPSAPRYPDGQLVLQGDQVMISAPGNTRERGVVLEVTEPEITVKVGLIRMYYEPEYLRLESRGDGVRYEYGQLVKPGDRVRVDDKPGVVLEIGFRAEVFVHMEEENTKKKWQVSELKFVERESEQSYNGSKTIEMGDKVQINNLMGDMDGAHGMVTFIGSKITVRTSETQWSLWEPEKLLLLERFNPQKGDIWIRVSDVFSVPAIIVIAGYTDRLVDYYGISPEYTIDMDRERQNTAPFVIDNFVFKERGIRVGDVRNNTVSGKQAKITKVDLLGSVEFYYTRATDENSGTYDMGYESALKYMPLEGDDHPLTNFFPKEPKIGDIWKEGNKRVLLIGVGSIMKYYILTDTNGIYSASPDTLFREDFLQRYSFHQTGPHVGDMWIGGEKVTITEVDYSLPITVFVQPFTTVRSFGLPFKQIMNTFQIESDGPSDDARLDQWTVWEQKNNSKKYIVTNVNKPKLTYVSTMMNTPMTMPIKQFLKEFAYLQDGPMVGQKWLKIGKDFEFVQISQLKPEHLLVSKQGDLDVKGTVSWENLLDDYIPQPEVKRTQLWARQVAESWEIRQVDRLGGGEVKLKAMHSMQARMITPQLDNFKREWIYYSELPTTGQVWQYKTTDRYAEGIKIIVRHISTNNVPYKVFFSEVGQGGRRFDDLKDFLEKYRSIDSGFPVVIPKRDEVWKHGKTEDRVKVTMVIPSTEATGPVVHFKGIGQDNTLIWRQEEFLQGYVPVDAIIPKEGDAYQEIKTKIIFRVKQVYRTGSRVMVLTTTYNDFEIQTWLRDFIPYETGEAKAEGLFPTRDLKTLMEKTKDQDLKGTNTISLFSLWLMDLKETTEEHVKMLGYLIEMGSAVHWTGEDIAPLEALYRIPLNKHVATMMIMMVKAGADAWANEKSSLVYALLQKRSPLAGKVLVDIINIGINTDDFYQLCMIPGRGDNPMGNLPGVMTAYFLEDGKLKEPFSDPNQEIKGNQFSGGKISRLHKLIASYSNAKRFKLRLQDIESVLDAHIYHPKLKLKKANIEGWFEAALATRHWLGEKRMDHLWGVFKKSRVAGKKFYLLKLIMEGGEVDEFIYVMESLKVDVNITSKKRTLTHILATMELHEGELEIFIYLVTNSKYDPNMLDKEGYTAVGRLLKDNRMINMEVYLGCVRLLLLLPQLTPNKLRAGGLTYLQVLCKSPIYKDIMKAYLKREDVDVNAKSVAGQTAMHIARYPEAWELLYSTGKVDLNAIDDKGRSILQLASDEEEKIKWLLSKEGEGLDTKGIIDYVVKNERNPMPFLEHWGPSYKINDTPILFKVHHLLHFNEILKIMDRDDFQPNLTDGVGNNYLSVIVLSHGRDNLLDPDRQMAVIKLLLLKGVDDKKKAIEAARNRGLQRIVNLLISAREKKVQDVKKKKRLELDKCTDYKKRVEKMDAEIEALNKLTDKEFEEKIGKAQMSKCQNEMDLITLAPWEALDYKNTLFLRVTDLQGKQRTYCLVEKFYKGESYTLNGKKYEEPDEQTAISQYIKKIRYADWVYAYDVGSHKKGRAYSKEDVETKSGEDGEPGRNRYVVFTPSDGTTYYVKHDKTLKKLIKMKEQRVQSDEYRSGYYNINGTSFELPKDWSLPLAIYVTAVKKLAIGNEAGSRGSSESHGNVMVMTYKVDRIVNFNSYDSIDEERECLGKCSKQPKLRF